MEKQAPLNVKGNRLAFLFEPVDAINVAIFRISFGLLMLWEVIYLMRLDFVEYFLERPKILFPYEPFTWIVPLPGPLMQLLIGLLAVACVLIALGKWYRPAMAVFFVGFSYIFLLDKAYYNNHLYLICLIAGWMCWITADKVLSLKGSGDLGDKYLPRWMLLILQLHIFIVYFYGGIAKLNPDWLFLFQPAEMLLQAKADQTGITWLTSDLMLRLITYGGALFDLLVGFLLFSRRFRPYAIAAAVFFNLTNSWLFDDINIFPYFMLCSLLLFVEPTWIRSALDRVWKPGPAGKKEKNAAASPAVFAWSSLTVWVLGGYLLLQALLPFRYTLIAGNVDWTGEAQRFSWRMKIQHRRMENLGFQIYDYDTRKMTPVDVKVMAAYGLNRDQMVQMIHDPKMARRFAAFLAEDYRKRTRAKKVEVKADIQVAYNGRPAQALIDPEVDLATAPLSLFRHNPWILPLKP